VFSLALFYIAVGLRLSDRTDHGRMVDTKTVLSILSIVLFLRFAHYYAINRNIGPKLIMIRKMFQHLFVFIALVILFVCGFGVAYNTLIFAQQPLDSHTIVSIFYRFVYVASSEVSTALLQQDPSP
jgi:hypothetical protein